MTLSKHRINRRGFLQSVAYSSALAGGLMLDGCLPHGARIHVIGSGITGLCTGALLARQGHEVHVLEAHPDLIGGHSAVFELDGFRFCVGPQFVWSFHKNGIGMRVLRFLGLEKRVPFDSISSNCLEEVRMGNDPGIEIPIGLDRYMCKAVEEFLGDTIGLIRFFSYIKDLFQGANLINDNGLYMEDEMSMRLAALLTPSLSERAKLRLNQTIDWSLKQLFDYCRLSEDVRRFLYSNSGIFIENESEVSCVAYAAGTGFYHSGAQYPRFGFNSLIEGLSDVIEIKGGSIRSEMNVQHLVTDGEKIKKVVCSDGETYETDMVISSISPRLTCLLLDRRWECQTSYIPSNSVTACFIGVHGYPGLSEKLGERIIWWQDGLEEIDYNEPDMTQPPRMFAIGSPSSNGDDNQNDNPEDHSIFIYTTGNFHQAASAYAQDPDDHDKLRDLAGELLLDQVERYVLEDLRSHIEVMEVHTPWDIYTRTGAELGNAYGRRLTAESLLTRPYTLDGIRNLYIGCASAGMPGIATAFQTAAIISRRITGRVI